MIEYFYTVELILLLKDLCTSTTSLYLPFFSCVTSRCHCCATLEKKTPQLHLLPLCLRPNGEHSSIPSLCLSKSSNTIV